MVLNAGLSLECPSLKLGLCQAGEHCYMRRLEKLRPNLQTQHIRQETAYLEYTAEKFVEQLFEYTARSRTKIFSEFRYGESGDFVNQTQLDWFADVSCGLREHGIIVYDYTARTDFNLTALVSNSQVNLSNDRYDSALYQAQGANRFKAVKVYSGNANVICPCPALKKQGVTRQCSHCNYCKVQSGLIEEILRK